MQTAKLAKTAEKALFYCKTGAFFYAFSPFVTMLAKKCLIYFLLVESDEIEKMCKKGIDFFSQKRYNTNIKTEYSV